MMGRACKATVLVVDDDAEVRFTTVQMLIVEGYRAMEASGASEAVRVLSKHDVDVLLTDIRMPGLSGFVLAQQARRVQPHLRVIFTTGRISQAQWDQRNGTVLRKPYRRDQLDAEIMKAIGGNTLEPPNACST